MKIKILLFILVLLPIDSFSTDYYFYENKKIDLQARQDKIAIVLKNNYSEIVVRNNISNILGAGDELKKILPEVYIINFTDSKSAVEIENLIHVLNSRKDVIKFTTKIYYGTSKKVSQIPADAFIVKLRSSLDIERLNILNFENDCSIIGSVGQENGFLIKSNSSVQKNALELSQIYYDAGIFEYAEPDFIFPEKCLLLSIPNDIFFNSQWSLRNTGQPVSTGSPFLFQGDAATVNGVPGSDMKVSKAWDYTTGSPAIKIGVIDTGIDSLHPDLQQPGHLLCGYDAFNNLNSSPEDLLSHGTSVAGIIGAVKDNGIGIAGIAPGCRLMSITIYDINGSTSSSIIARAFDTASARGIDVICNGWGGATPQSLVTNAINNAAVNGRYGAGCVILFGSGNDGRNPPVYPSTLSNVVSVGGSTPHDQKKSPGTGNQFYWGSNYGEDINGDLDITAPTNCYSLMAGGLYDANFTGTSCSVPNAAGVAALILSVNPSLSRTQVLDILYKGCDKIDNVEYSIEKTSGKWNIYYGYGRINALNSVRLAAGIDVIPPTINHTNVSSHSSTYPTIIKAEIKDQDGSGIPLTGNNAPVLFFKIKKNNASWTLFDSVNSYSSAGNNLYFKIPSQGWETEVEYYIRARDNNGNESTFPYHAPDNFWLCYYAVGNIISETKRIPSFAGADFGATISPSVYYSGFKIVDAKVKIYMRHTYLNDEIIQIFSPLTDPNNNRKCLFSSNGNDMDNITGASVSDSGSSNWSSSNPPYTNGDFFPEFPLKGLNGQNAVGNWRLLHFDRGVGDYAFFDSVKITLFKTNGTLCPSARLDSPGDSTLNFGEVISSHIYDKDFYLRNSGTSDLSIIGYSFTGSYSTLYSLLNIPPTVISPNDSGLFKVRLNTNTAQQMSRDNDAVTGALLNIQTNDPDKNIFKVSLQTNDSLGNNIKNLQLKMLLEGMYNVSTGLTVKDTVSVYLRQTTFPYSPVDSSTNSFDSLGVGSFNFRNAMNSVSYYIAVIHRNGVETWCSTGQSFSASSLNYDFTDNISKAYGNNLTLRGSKYCFFSGDINHDGYIDLTDLELIYNSSNIFTVGYKNEDLNGDYIIDLSDLIKCYNNSLKFVRAISP